MYFSNITEVFNKIYISNQYHKDSATPKANILPEIMDPEAPASSFVHLSLSSETV